MKKTFCTDFPSISHWRFWIQAQIPFTSVGLTHRETHNEEIQSVVQSDHSLDMRKLRTVYPGFFHVRIYERNKKRSHYQLYFGYRDLCCFFFSEHSTFLREIQNAGLWKILLAACDTVFYSIHLLRVPNAGERNATCFVQLIQGAVHSPSL